MPDCRIQRSYEGPSHGCFKGTREMRNAVIPNGELTRREFGNEFALRTRWGISNILRMKAILRSPLRGAAQNDSRHR